MPRPRPIKSATMAWLLEQNPAAEIALRCFNKRYDGTVELHRVRFAKRWTCEVLAEQWSPWMTVDQVERLARCSVCNGGYPDVRAEVIFPDGARPGAVSFPTDPMLLRPGVKRYPHRR